MNHYQEGRYEVTDTKVPKLDAVESSNLIAVGYDTETQTFGARFKSSPDFVYVYFDVPEKNALAVIEAEGHGISVGFAFSTMIKKGKFKFEKKPWLEPPSSLAESKASLVMLKDCVPAPTGFTLEGKPFIMDSNGRSPATISIPFGTIAAQVCTCDVEPLYMKEGERCGVCGLSFLDPKFKK